MRLVLVLSVLCGLVGLACAASVGMLEVGQPAGAASKPAEKPALGEECGWYNKIRAWEGACLTEAACKKVAPDGINHLPGICQGALTCCIGSSATKPSKPAALVEKMSSIRQHPAASKLASKVPTKPNVGDDCGWYSKTRAWEGICLTEPACKKVAPDSINHLPGICSGALTCCIGAQIPNTPATATPAPAAPTF
jgi:hypothetical protein